MICTLDLFPVPESVLDNRHIHRSRYSSAMTNMDRLVDLQVQPLTFFPLHPYSTLEYPGTSHSPFHIPRRQSMLTQLTSQTLHDVVFRLDNHLVTESSKLTPALVGEKFVEPVLIDHMGRKSLIFVFSVSFPYLSPAFLISMDRISQSNGRAPSFSVIEYLISSRPFGPVRIALFWQKFSGARSRCIRQGNFLVFRLLRNLPR